MYDWDAGDCYDTKFLAQEALNDIVKTAANGALKVAETPLMKRRRENKGYFKDGKEGEARTCVPGYHKVDGSCVPIE